MFAHNMGRTERGNALVMGAAGNAGFHRGVHETDHRPGDIAFAPERIAEAEVRKARAKEAELAKANRNRS